jgi:hypothetical protein
MVSLYTDYERESIRILIVGKNGSLAFEVDNKAPSVTFPSADPGERFIAYAGIEANGRFKGFFAKKGATQREGNWGFFPARKNQKRPVKARQAPKSGRKEG